MKEVWYKRLFYALPKWARVILIILSIITMVWWIGFIIYKILCAFRAVMAFLFDKRNYWTFLVCILILGVGSLLIAQFALGLDPFGNMVNWFIDKFNEFRSWLGSLIGGGN